MNARRAWSHEAGLSRKDRPTVISAAPHSLLDHVYEVWDHRELLYFLVWRNIKLRYAQTVFGVAWVLLQPVMTSVVLALIFGRFVGISTDGTPHFLFYLAALVPWMFFSAAVTRASDSLVAHHALLTKVYFPRLCLPLAAVLSAATDTVISFLCLLGFMVIWGVAPTGAGLLAAAFLLGLTLVLAVGVGAALSATNLRFRDVVHIIPFALQLLAYASPILYPASYIPSAYRWFYYMNPMAGVIAGFRSVLFGSAPFAIWTLVVSLVMSIVIMLCGLTAFVRAERRFADFA